MGPKRDQIALQLRAVSGPIQPENRGGFASAGFFGWRQFLESFFTPASGTALHRGIGVKTKPISCLLTYCSASFLARGSTMALTATSPV
jgi:hypothetical protein